MTGSTAARMTGEAAVRQAEEDVVLNWVTRPEDLLPLHGEWRALADRTGADIYLTPEWFSVWWRYFGAGRDLACLVARREGRLVGLLPFSLERVGAGPLSGLVARLAGTDPHCIVFALPLESETASQAFGAALSHLAARCDAVSLTPASERSQILTLARAACSGEKGPHLTDEDAGAHIVFDLPESFEAYLASLSKKRRHQFRRDVRALESLGDFDGRTIFPDAADVDGFVDFHERQWQAAGLEGHFRDWPGSAAFYRDLAGVLAPDRRMWLDTMSAGGAPLAAQFCLVSGGTCHWRLPARSLDPEAEEHSAGKVGLVLMIGRLIAAGVRRIEGGSGEYDYKHVYGGKSVPLRRLIVRRADPAAARRLSRMLKAADLLHLVYYRGWFLKAAPGLRRVTGRHRRALWRAWIASRI